MALAVASGALLGGIATFAQPVRYAAEGAVVVSPARFLDPSGTDALPALTDTVVELSSREAVLKPTGAAYVASAPNAAVRARRERQAILPWLQEHTRARRAGTSSVVGMTATGADALDATDLSRAFVSSLTEFVRSARTGEVPTQDSTPAGVALVVLSPGELMGQVSPTPLRNVLLGANAGLIAGIVLALATSARRRRRGAAQAPAELGVPSLGDVQPGAPEPGGGLFATHNLIEALSAPGGSLAVTLTGSSAPGRIADVAESLARSLDRTGNRVLLVDADGERRELSRRLGAGERPGLLDAVANGTDPGRLVVVTRPAPGSGEAQLHLLPIGTSSGSELDRQRLHRLLERLELQFNVVVISGPPLADTADVGAFVSAADCWLLVADASVTSRRLGEVRTLMEQSGTPMMGTLGVDGAASQSRLPAALR